MPQYAIMRFAKQKGGAGALEAHMGQMKKYKSTIDSLMQENAPLKKEVNDSKPSIIKQLDVVTLKQENES